MVYLFFSQGAVKALAEEGGADPSERNGDRGYTVLHAAAEQG